MLCGDNMKKILSLLILISLFATLLAGCKGRDTDTPGTDDVENGSDDTGDTGDTGDKTEELPGVDLLNADLSEYVEIDEKYYKNYTVTVDPNRVSELDVENEIIQLLCKHKSKESVTGDGVISVGDVVHIYYRGYYMKDGEKYFFEGGDNTSSATPHTLEIGSGGFIPGFEYNLIGKNPQDYTADSPIEVETFFPKNYSSSELAGKTAYFIVTVEKLVEYDAPELNEAFILETLKLDEQVLSEYEGEGILEKFRSYIREAVTLEMGLDVETLSINAFWESALAGAVIKKYPEKQVKEIYDSYVSELEYYFRYYTMSGFNGNFDEFVCAYIGLDKGADWKADITSMAKESVKQQLIFYHIMNIEGLKPTKEKFDELLEDYAILEMKNKGNTEEDYQTKDEYLAAVKEYKEKLIKDRGEDYFKSAFYYEIGMDAIVSYANVVEKSE